MSKHHAGLIAPEPERCRRLMPVAPPQPLGNHMVFPERKAGAYCTSSINRGGGYRSRNSAGRVSAISALEATSRPT